MRLTFLSVLLVSSGALALVGARAAGAVTIPTAPSKGAVDSAKAEAVHLEGEIAADNDREQSAGETYDEAEVRLGQANERLATTKVDIARENVAIARAKTVVRTTAVADYVYGSNEAAELGQFLTGKLADSGTFNAYAQVATHALQSAVNVYVGAKAQLTKSEAAASTARAQAAGAVGQAAAARNAAADAADRTRTALASVNGQIKQDIADQAAHDAAVAEARRDAARAEQDAALAGTLAASDPAASTAATQAAISASTLDSGGKGPIVLAGTNALGTEAVHTAESFLGIPYVFGGASRSGVDCSGLTMLSWRSAGVSLVHSAWYQYKETSRVSLQALEPGDLLFYYFPDDGGDPVTHVAMYVGSGPYGTQTIIQAPETGEDVELVPMYYYGFVGAGRPAAAGAGSPTPATTTTTVGPPTTTTVASSVPPGAPTPSEPSGG